MIMVCCSLAELFIQYKVIAIAFKSVWHQFCVAMDERAQKRGKPIAFFAKHGKAEEHNENIVEDPARPEDQVKTWMWVLGLLTTLGFAFVICQIQWVSSWKCASD